MVVSTGDMNAHVGSRNLDYDGMHGGFGYEDGNGDGSSKTIVCVFLFRISSAHPTWGGG